MMEVLDNSCIFSDYNWTFRSNYNKRVGGVGALRLGDLLLSCLQTGQKQLECKHRHIPTKG